MGGEEECHDKTITTAVDRPEEVCDLTPEKTCRLSTVLVPSLEPEQECTIVPKETCHLSFPSPTPAKKTLLTKWCLEDSQPGQEDSALPQPVREDSNSLSEASAGDNDPDIAPEDIIHIG